jgi:hypothetical protein
MEWINIHTSTLDSEYMLDARPEDHSTWLYLQKFCHSQENGGVIVGAKKWPDSKFQRLLRKSRADVVRKSPLWDWKGADLSVKFFPFQKQLEIQAKREGAKNGGKARGAQLQAQAEASRQPMAKAQAEASDKPDAQAEAQRKGREGKGSTGKGREREEPTHPEVSVPSEEDIRTWARMSGVDEGYASKKFHETDERHGWQVNGRLIDWRKRFKRFWEEDREKWFSKKKSAAVGASGKPPGWQDGDQEWWWADSISTVEAALRGACIGNDNQTSARLRAVIAERTKQ